MADLTGMSEANVNDLELRIDCPACSARAGEDCRGFGYCPARSAAAGDSDTQPDPYIDAMAAEHKTEFDPDWVIAPSETLAEWMHENGMSVQVLATGARAFGPKSVTKEHAIRLIRDVLERKPLTAEHATCLARGTGVSTEFWLNYEHNYRAGLAAGLTDTSGPLPVILSGEERPG